MRLDGRCIRAGGHASTSFSYISWLLVSPSKRFLSLDRLSPLRSGNSRSYSIISFSAREPERLATISVPSSRLIRSLRPS